MSDKSARPNLANTPKRGGIRLLTLATGILLVLVSPIIGALPGPGFIIIFPVGLALILKSSRTAKRLYARFSYKYPRYGRWTNMALRRSKKHAPDDLEPTDDGKAA